MISPGYTPSRGAPITAAWARAVGADLQASRLTGDRVIRSSAGTTISKTDVVTPRRAVAPAPFAVRLAGGDPDWRLVVTPGRVNGAEPALGAGWTETVDATGERKWSAAIAADGAKRAVVVADGSLELAAAESASGTVLAYVVEPDGVASAGVIDQRVYGDVASGGGGAVLGRVTGGGGGVYMVELASGESATVTATEVAAGASLPVGAYVICHPVAVDVSPGAEVHQ